MTADRTENPQESLDALTEYLRHKNVSKACRALGINRVKFDGLMSKIGLTAVRVPLARNHVGNPAKTERDKAMASAYRSGATLAVIADSHGVTKQAVHQVLTRMRVKMRSAGGPKGPRPNYHRKLRLRVIHPARVVAMQRKADVARLYAQGLKGKDVATQLGVSLPSVYAILKRQGIPRRPKGNRVKPQVVSPPSL